MFLKNRNISSKIKRSKVTDHAALGNRFALYVSLADGLSLKRISRVRRSNGSCRYVLAADLSVTSHINCIVARCLINFVYLTACCLYQVMMTLHFLSDVANDAESTQNQKLRHYR